jgi:hypothetical protein
VKSELEIGKPLRLEVTYYDWVCEPPKQETFDGEVIGWRNSQVIVRVPGYAVLRFWKRSGTEVGNKDFDRRGFRVDLGNHKGVSVDLDTMPVATDTDA